MNKDKAIFITRLILTIISAVVVPFTYMTARFNLFQATTKIQFGFWGLILIAIMGLTIGMLIKFYLDGMKTKYSYLKQVLSGAIKIIIPLLIAIFVLRRIGSNIDYVIELLLVLTCCETVAILINPLPKRAFQNNVDGIGEITDMLIARREKRKAEKEEN